MVRQRASSLPHIRFLDLENNGIFTECAILKEDAQGNITFIDITKLDDIDKTRISKIVQGRNATSFELWDLMSQTTLNNGMNALEYFHQLAKVISPEGIIFKPVVGKVGSTKQQQPQPQVQPQAQPQQVVEQEAAPAKKSARKKTAQKDAGADGGDA